MASSKLYNISFNELIDCYSVQHLNIEKKKKKTPHPTHLPLGFIFQARAQHECPTLTTFLDKSSKIYVPISRF